MLSIPYLQYSIDSYIPMRFHINKRSYKYNIPINRYILIEYNCYIP